jgi:hypothetical protein
MEKTSTLGGLVLFLLVGCGLLSSLEEPTIQQGEFFPLKLGQQWAYRITEADMDTSRIGFPKRFTVSVVDELTVDDKKYHLVVNYFVPGPTLPDTILVRSAGSQVFIRFSPEHEECLFYAFTPADTFWSVPMYINSDTTYPYYGSLQHLTDNSAAVRWGLFLTPGRDEAGWREIFDAGVGRTEINASFQVIGKVVWSLEKAQ